MVSVTVKPFGRVVAVACAATMSSAESTAERR